MIEMQHLAPIMFGSLVLAMLVGFPVAFTLGGAGAGLWLLRGVARLLP